MIRAALIEQAERRTGEDAGWMRDISALGRGAFWRLLGFHRFASFRRTAPPELAALARLGAVMAEDCGPCTRIVAKAAKHDGMPTPLIRAALAGGSELEADAGLAYRFGHAIAAAAPNTGELGAAIEMRYGRRVLTELAMAAATVRVYPALKRGLGYAQACVVTRFDDL